LRTITEQAMPAERSASTRSGMLARAQLGRSAAPPWDDERYPRRAPTHRTPVGPAPAPAPAPAPRNQHGFQKIQRERDAEKACVAECPSAVRTPAACAETRCVCSEGQREDGPNPQTLEKSINSRRIRWSPPNSKAYPNRYVEALCFSLKL